jgi:hypothetical protein
MEMKKKKATRPVLMSDDSVCFKWPREQTYITAYASDTSTRFSGTKYLQI